MITSGWECLLFVMVDLLGYYYRILSHMYYTKFMVAIPDYVYFNIKVPGSKGVIAVRNNFEKAYKCEQCEPH